MLLEPHAAPHQRAGSRHLHVIQERPKAEEKHVVGDSFNCIAGLVCRPHQKREKIGEEEHEVGHQIITNPTNKCQIMTSQHS